jgi:PAS domain S-box-containing protein
MPDPFNEHGTRTGLLETFLQTASIGFAVLDDAFRFVQVNGAIATVHASVDAHIGKTVGEVVPQLWPALEPLCVRALAGETVTNHDVSGVDTQGRRRHWLVSCCQLRLQDDSAAVGVIVTDVTKRSEAELRIQQLNRLHAVVSDINQAILREPNPAMMLDAACRIAVEQGRFEMAWIGLVDQKDGKLHVTAHAGAAADTLEILDRLIDAGQRDCTCVFTLRALGTGEHAVCNDITLDPDAECWRDAALQRGYRALASLPLRVKGSVIGTFNVYAGEAGFFDAEELRLLDELAADIAFALEIHDREVERQHIERALRESEERFRELAENIHEVFWMTDPARRAILYISPAYDEIWGRSREELYSSPQRWLDTIHPDDRSRIGDTAVTRQATEYDAEYRIVRPDGSHRWIRDRAFPVKDAHGRVIRVAGVAEDITERRELEAQLHHAQKMEAVGRLAGGVAHDFNNLLTIITGYSDLLLESLEADEDARPLVEQIRKAGERSAALTRQLLALSRKQVLAPKVIDLNTQVRETESILRRVIGEDIELTTALRAQPGRIRADPGQLDQLLLNLAVNARDAMPHGGTLTIETRDITLNKNDVRVHGHVRPGPYVLLVMTDSGVGMSAEIQQHLFEPFFTTKEPGKGTGLGLAVVHGFVKQSGGHIDIHSKEGVGTSVRVYLPQVEQSVTRKESAAASSLMPRGSETILLVEDEDAVRNLTSLVLRNCGYRLLEAGDGEHALRACARFDGAIDLIVTDVVMPGMSGRIVVDRLRALYPQVKVLYMSGYTDDTVVRQGIFEADVNFLQKPFTATALALKVREALDG